MPIEIIVKLIYSLEFYKGILKSSLSELKSCLLSFFLYQKHPVLNCMFFLKSHASFRSFPQISLTLRLYFKNKDCLCLIDPDIPLYHESSSSVMLKCLLSLGLNCSFASTSVIQKDVRTSSWIFLELVHCSSLPLRTVWIVAVAS